MSTFIAEPLSLDGGYDIPSDVAEVVEASRHLCDYRAGLAEALEATAERAVTRMPDEGARMLEPLLRILGADKAKECGDRLYVAACQVIGHWDPDADADLAARTLTRLCRDAAHDIADGIQRDTRICCNATKETHR